MQVTSLSSIPTTATAVAQSRPTDTRQFEAMLKENGGTQHEARKRVEDAAAGLVAQALILPMLKQVRRSTLGGKGPFSPGIAEKSFGPEFDMQLADRIAHSPRMAATQGLTDRLMKRTAPEKALDVNG
jgi:hypothetical protein